MTDAENTTEETPVEAAEAAEAAPVEAVDAPPVEAEAEPTEEAAEPDYSTVAAPEDAELPEGALDETVAWAKENGVAPEVASAVLARDIANRAAAQAHADEMNAQWETELKADKEIGGPKYAGAMKAAERFVVEYGGQEAWDEFNASNVRNYPPFKRLFAKAGLANSEPRKHESGKSTAKLDPNSWEARFGTPDPSKPRREVATS